MHFVRVEALTFGLARLIEAAETLAIHLHLLTHHKDLYFYELGHIKSTHLSVIECDTFRHAEIITYCQNLKNCGDILNLTDTWATNVNEISAQLGYKTPNAYAINICRDKACLRKALCEKGLTKGQLTVIKRDAFQATHDLSYPVIVKAPQGTGSKNLWFAENKTEFTAIMELIKTIPLSKASLLKPSLQAHSTAPKQTMSYQGKTKLLALSSRIISDMPDFKELAIALPLDKNTLELQGIEEWIKNILAAISYHESFAHTEFIVTEEGFEVIEINPRLGGVQIGEALCQAFNTNIYKSFLECACGRKAELLQRELIPQTFIGQALIYVKTTGQFQQMHLKHAGRKQTVLSPCALQGKEILNLRDQSACVGILLTTGISSETALLNALSEANKVNLVVEQ